MKKLMFSLLLAITVSVVFAQANEYQLSSHILDISTGKPAPEVEVILEKKQSDSSWVSIGNFKTDNNGRISNMLPYGKIDNKGIYKLIFKTHPYFEKANISSFYPFIEVVFSIAGTQHYHVPITVSPFGYSTYRGN